MAKNLASSSQGIDRSRIAGIPGCYDSVATNVPVMDETVLSTSDVGVGVWGAHRSSHFEIRGIVVIHLRRPP